LFVLFKNTPPTDANSEKLIAINGAFEMGSAFQKAIAQVWASSELQLSPTTANGLQRVIPLGLAINVWLKKSMLFGVILVAIALVLLAIAIPKGLLPTFVALWIDHRDAKAVVDSVQRREITKSKGMKETRWEIRYHFTPQNGQQLQGESYTSFSALKKGAQVDVEYYPKRPESNRIKGMTAKSDANSPAILCLILMAVGLVAIAAELPAARRSMMFRCCSRNELAYCSFKRSTPSNPSESSGSSI
jgi:hypothetical protein